MVSRFFPAVFGDFQGIAVFEGYPSGVMSGVPIKPWSASQMSLFSRPSGVYIAGPVMSWLLFQLLFRLGGVDGVSIAGVPVFKLLFSAGSRCIPVLSAWLSSLRGGTIVN